MRVLVLLRLTDTTEEFHHHLCISRRLEFRFAVLLSIILLLTAVPVQALRPWNIVDTIEISEIQYSRSPDYRYLAVVTTCGIVQSNRLESKLLLFDTINAKNFIESDTKQYEPAGRLLLTMAVEPSGNWEVNHVISDIHWSESSNKLFFLARCGRTCEHRLFSIDTATRQTRQLSLEGQDVTTFDVAEDNCVYASTMPADPDLLCQSAGGMVPDIEFAAGKPLLDLLYPNRRKYTFELGAQDVWVVQNSKNKRLEETGSRIPLRVEANPQRISISPDGKFIVMAQQVECVPASWEQYTPCTEYGFSKFVSGSYGIGGIRAIRVPERYLLVDVASGKSSVLVDAPLGITAGYYDWTALRWSKDSQKIALSSVYYPLTNTGENPHLRPCVMVVDVHSKQVEFVSERPAGREGCICELSWVHADHWLRLRYFALPTELYQQMKGQWRSINSGSEGFDHQTQSEITFTLHRSFNQAPILVAHDSSTKKEKTFLDPNPQLAEIEMTNASILKWRDKTGREQTGGLIKPIGYNPGQRYPLVIQTYGFFSDAFFADGYYKSAFPGRALASRGMFVLQMDGVPPGKSMLPEGAKAACESYLSAIDQLNADGLIDPKKVGIIGFSHSGFYVLNMLTHEPGSIRAAVLGEATTASFTEYLNGVDWASADFLKDTAGLIGSTPFGAGMHKWLSDSPGFNTDKIDAAVMFQSYSPKNLAFSWSIYPALRAQSKAVELLYIRSGVHELENPRQRFASQEASLDWFDFWLNNHEDAEPAKREQYARWRLLPKYSKK